MTTVTAGATGAEQPACGAASAPGATGYARGERPSARPAVSTGAAVTAQEAPMPAAATGRARGGDAKTGTAAVAAGTAVSPQPGVAAIATDTGHSG
ncbi:hypothetical protein [Mycobacterium persicum]|uniref:hypothetical protein n=1 Tax=Mycobacterium persicum TaxID=1487726 RepID=UPI001F087E56